MQVNKEDDRIFFTFTPRYVAEMLDLFRILGPLYVYLTVDMSFAYNKLLIRQNVHFDLQRYPSNCVKINVLRDDGVNQKYALPSGQVFRTFHHDYTCQTKLETCYLVA